MHAMCRCFKVDPLDGADVTSSRAAKESLCWLETSIDSFENLKKIIYNDARQI